MGVTQEKLQQAEPQVKLSGSFSQQHCFYFTHITPIMTFWADNIKFIKDIQDSKYKKIEDCIAELNEQIEALKTDKDNKKAREHFVEASRTLEIMNMEEVDSLADTMFKDMPDNSDKKREVDKLAEVKAAYVKAISTIKESKKTFGL